MECIITSSYSKFNNARFFSLFFSRASISETRRRIVFEFIYVHTLHSIYRERISIKGAVPALLLNKTRVHMSIQIKRDERREKEREEYHTRGRIKNIFVVVVACLREYKIELFCKNIRQNNTRFIMICIA